MIEDILRFYKSISHPQIKIDTLFKEIIQDYSIFHISESSFPNDDEKQKITDKIKESQVVIVDQNKELNQKMQNKYFIIGFEKTLIIFEYSSKLESSLRKLFSIHSQILICNLSDQNDKTQIFKNEINEFKKKFDYNNIYSHKAWKITHPCILGYLIKKSYLKLNQNRFEKFKSDRKEPEFFNEKEYVELRNVGNGSFAQCILAYHIIYQELFIVKKPRTIDTENEKLLKREKENYQKIKHPLLPKFYGTVKGKGYLVIEFINGSTLKRMNTIFFNFFEKIKVIYELLLIMKYLCDNNFIYRDLKPTNIMVDENKTAVLIDFDRLISIENNEEMQEQTLDINAEFIAPEVNVNKKFTYKSDIYSLGKIIENIISKKEGISSGTLLKLKSIIEECTKDNPEDRPSISTLIDHFYANFKTEIIYEHAIENLLHIENTELQLDNKLFLDESQFPASKTNSFFECFLPETNQNDPKKLFNQGEIYQQRQHVIQNINKLVYYLSLATNQNDPEAQFNLGLIYHEGRYVTRDINKAIHYFSLAANQNHPKAQYNLSLIYYEGLYVTRNINKSIYYLSLAANQNHPKAQYNLGFIYYEGLYVARDINKSIYYLSLAANQNDPEAQLGLGSIYYEGKYITRDIKKSIYYFSLAADQNCTDAQLNLSRIYYLGCDVTRDVNKAIHYLSLAVNQNNILAQLRLGSIYFEGKYITRDINKAIHYFSLAANQNDPKAQFLLGFIYYERRDINKLIHYFSLAADQNCPEAQLKLGDIYYEGRYIARDIHKSIHYLSLAADLNCPEAQFNLGVIYDEGRYVKQDINKAIHYYSLAANQNFPNAQYNLGIIYYEGRDTNKAIHYFSLAANLNFPKAQYCLGIIYYEGRDIARDISKSIHYLSLAADLNCPEAQFNLGVIYDEGRDIARDINKAIHYYSLAANQNFPIAQYNLGLIYYEGRDTNKAIHYFSLAANRNHPKAQLKLGVIYYEGQDIARDINKSIYYLSLASDLNCSEAQFYLGHIYYEHHNIKQAQFYLIKSSSNNYRPAHFAHGFLLHSRNGTMKDIHNAIHYYKEASSFNNQYAKNNLGIIYKNGFGNEIKANIGNAIVYFEEAIRQKNDYLSMYNLAHIYIYSDLIEHDIDKSITLLVRSSNQFVFSLFLLCIILMKKYGDISCIMQEIKNLTDDNDLPSKVNALIKFIISGNEEVFFNLCRWIDFLYDIFYRPILSSNLQNAIYNGNVKHPFAKNISDLFYEGFGRDLFVE